MKKGDLIRKIAGGEIGIVGVIIDIITVPIIPEESCYYKYAIVNTAIGVRRWYCNKMEIVGEPG